MTPSTQIKSASMSGQSKRSNRFAAEDREKAANCVSQDTASFHEMIQKGEK
jgi:hypothetical protein